MTMSSACPVNLLTNSVTPTSDLPNVPSFSSGIIIKNLSVNLSTPYPISYGAVNNNAAITTTISYSSVKQPEAQQMEQN